MADSLPKAEEKNVKIKWSSKAINAPNDVSPFLRFFPLSLFLLLFVSSRGNFPSLSLFSHFMAVLYFY